MTGNERHIIVSVDLETHPSQISVDLGNIAPHIAYAVLAQALDALENDAMQRTFAGGVRISNAAIALRAALAEPAAPQSEAVHEARPATEDDMKVYQAIADNYYRTAAPSVPAGWRLVPVEPTDDMLHAAMEVNPRLTEYEVRQAYSNAIDAAPEAPSGKGDK